MHIRTTPANDGYGATPGLSTLYAKNAALWDAVYANRQTQLGNTATLVNCGDTSNAGALSAATFTGMKFNASGLSPTWTPSAALSALTTAVDVTNLASWQGKAPVMTLTASASEKLSTPDAAYWSRDDSAGQGFSMGLWVKFTAIGTSMTLWSKGNSNPDGNSEWFWYKTSGDKADLYLRDSTVGVTAHRPSSTAIAAGTWYHLVVTYDGGGGATAANGINTYLNGVADNGAATNDGTYVKMRDQTMTVEIGSAQSSTYLGATIAIGPFCPFWCQVQLTAAQVANLYALERLGLGV